MKRFGGAAIMEAPMRSVLYIACLTAALALPAQAQKEGQSSLQPVEIDTNLICETPQQIERFLTLLDEKSGSAEAAIEAVNKESQNEDACVIATTAYRRVGVASIARNNAATFDVTRIVVIGVYTLTGPERSLPTELFT
jgi:hypothetical protein